MSLRVAFAGLELRNPVIAASGTPTRSYRCLQRAIDAGAGSAVTKSIVSAPADGKGAAGLSPRPRHHLMCCDTQYVQDAGRRERSCFTLMGAAEPYPTPDDFEPIIWQYKAASSVPIIVSISGRRGEYGEWVRLAKRMEKAGADALELCMHHVPASEALDPHLVTEVKSGVSIPVIAKVRTAGGEPAVVGPALQEAGADGITAISGPTVRGLEIDVNKREFVLQPSFCSFRGPWYRPVGLGWIARLAQCVDVDLCGVAGVTGWQDVVKYILVGATAVQVCSAIYAYGYEVLGEMVRGLEEYMGVNGYETVSDFRGAMLRALRPMKSVAAGPMVVAMVNEAKCTGCGRCEATCFYDSIVLEKGVARVLPRTCQGCGLCVDRCPEGAIKLAM